jgi:hypothetical protein
MSNMRLFFDPLTNESLEPNWRGFFAPLVTEAGKESTGSKRLTVQ